MAYNVLDISKFIINYSNRKNYNIQMLKLQKLLYFVQAYFICNTKKKCFKEKIEAWEFGPVIPEVFEEYKQFGNADIPANSFDEKEISKTHRKMIKDVIKEFKDHSITQVTKITQNQTPWQKAYKPNEKNEITPESIKEFFDE